VAAIVIGKNVKPGFQSTTAYNHYSILKTIETSWGLGSLTSNDANANVMSDFFLAPPVPATSSGSEMALLLLLGVSGVVASLRGARRSATT
jgi:acid phosphatase